MSWSDWNESLITDLVDHLVFLADTGHDLYDVDLHAKLEEETEIPIRNAEIKEMVEEIEPYWYLARCEDIADQPGSDILSKSWWKAMWENNARHPAEEFVRRAHDMVKQMKTVTAGYDTGVRKAALETLVAFIERDTPDLATAESDVDNVERLMDAVEEKVTTYKRELNEKPRIQAVRYGALCKIVALLLKGVVKAENLDNATVKEVLLLGRTEKKD